MSGQGGSTLVRAALGLGLILGAATSGQAQVTGRTESLSSGSGAGTGTGTGAGAGINSTGGGTGEITGPGSIRSGTGINPGPGGVRGGAAGFLDPNDLRRMMRAPRVPLTPSPGARSVPGPPTDIMPPMGDLASPLYGPDANLPQGVMERLGARLLPDARRINDPAERSLSLYRTAKAKIFAHEFREAHIALVEASEAVMQVPPGLVRDLRLMGIATTLIDLAHEDVQEGLMKDLATGPDEEDTRPPRTLKERMVSISSAEQEWALAARMAATIQNHNFRSEQLYRVVDGQAIESQTIAHTAEQASTDRRDLEGQGPGLLDFADRTLLNAQRHADMITRPVWRDRALLEVTSKAAYSDQFPRALEVARTIPDPEIRTDALVRVSEGLARRNLGPQATQVYAEAATAVSEVPDDDIRGVIAGVLIDSLIATGRFDDARRCVVLMPDVTRQIVALGAVAESQGKRGLADRARQWIQREAPEEYRAMLNRKVDDGELGEFDQLKTQQLTTGGRLR